MAGYPVEIRTTEGSSDAIDLGTVVVRHHLTDQAAVTAEVLSGAHLLHLAVAGCLFNDLLREAARRDLALTDVRVTADGRFDGPAGESTGISCAIDVTSDAAEADVRRLVADVQEDASIPLTLKRGTTVTLTDLRIAAR
jgi:uncharacterized OsmC-like protein